MNKFTRKNTSNGEEVEMFGTKGTILSIGKDPKTNSNGNDYHIFSAKIEGTRGSLTCLGQVYVKAFDFIGGMPKPGDEFGFAAAISDLKAGNNKLWTITGVEVDEIDEGMLEDLDNL